MNRRILAGIFASLALLAGGCAVGASYVKTKDGVEYGVTRGTFRGRWWSYYERGSSYMAGGFLAEAEADFLKALDGRARDSWRARTYGLHFTEYFPVRELGVCLFRQGRVDEAESRLAEALGMVDTERAHAFLDAVKKAKIARGDLRDDTDPQLAANLTPARIISERELPVEATVADDTGVAEVRVNEKRVTQRGSKTEMAVKETVVLDEGVHEITVAAKDLADKETTAKVEVTVDLTGPTLGIFNPIEPTVTPQNTVILEGAAADKHGVTRVSVDKRLLAESPGAPRLPFSAELPLARGENSFIVASRDMAGNETRSAVKVFQGDPESAEARLWLLRQRHPEGLVLAAGDGALAVTMLLAQDPAPEGDGEIRLKSPQPDKPYRHSRTMTVSGEVVAKEALTSLTINGQPVEQLTGAPKESFNRRIPLGDGPEPEGRIQVAVRAEDAGGRVLDKTVDIEVRPVALNSVESRMPVAVLAFAGADVAEADVARLRAETEGALSARARFRQLDRENLQQVLTEQQLAAALADPAQAISLGRLVNAQIFLVGELFPRDEKGIEIKVRVIGTETSDLVAVLDAYVEDKADGAQVKRAGDALAAQLEALYPRLSGEILAVRGQELLVDWTREDGVREGAYMLVVKETPPWVDEDTGEVLAPPEFAPVGRARLESPGAANTRAKTVDINVEDAQLEKGMPAVTM